MNKYRCSLMVILLMIGLFCLSGAWCTRTKDGNDTDALNKKMEVDENQILIINRYVNFANGYEDEGMFIDAKGRVYLYDFSQFIYLSKMGNEKDRIMENLKAVQVYSEPVLTLEEGVVFEMIQLCLAIDPEERYEEKHAAYDYGSRILYVCNDEDMIQCREMGDFEGALESASAKKFMKYFDDTLMPIIASYCEQMSEEEYTNAKAFYYAENALYFQNIHYGYSENTGRYVVTNEAELAALESVFGTDFGIGEWDTNHAVDCIYFVEHVNVSSGGYDLKSAGILCQGGAFKFVPSKDSRVPVPGELYTEALDGFVYVGAVPTEVAQLFVNPENGCYADALGNEWKRPK